MLEQSDNDELKKYREQYISSDQLLALQDTTSFVTIIKPQTVGEKIFTIQESFEAIFDPDIYEEEVKSLAQRFFNAANKSVIVQSLSSAEYELLKKIPIVSFIKEIKDLNLEALYHESEQ